MRYGTVQKPGVLLPPSIFPRNDPIQGRSRRHESVPLWMTENFAGEDSCNFVKLRIRLHLAHLIARISCELIQEESRVPYQNLAYTLPV